MFSPLNFSPTTLTAHWSDSPLLHATSVFDLPFHILDAGRQDFGTPRVYYPVLPVDGEGHYRSPKAAFSKQVLCENHHFWSPLAIQWLLHKLANKKDPRWKDAGIGLGLGLSGVTKKWGVLQSTYVLSRQPLFLGTLHPGEKKRNEEQKPVVAKEELSNFHNELVAAQRASIAVGERSKGWGRVVERVCPRPSRKSHAAAVIKND
ncbi:hypothetical protein B0H11DRAFT_1941197 [Mycena galericulata]|nr:hypothetical protein B0H11DRAFT_1941197 [Mycena galericulata]